MKKSFFMWGERGVVATFFADMHLCGTEADWQNLLEAIESSSPAFPRTVTAVTAIIEPDFGNRGFGHPDAVLLLERNSERFVLILEAKRRAYARSCGKQRGQLGYNSTLKGQLELNYVLTLALSALRPNDASLVEPIWVGETPYANGCPSRDRAELKSSAVLEAFGRSLSGLPLQKYFHVVLTTDVKNPLIESSNFSILPEIYTAQDRQSNGWHGAQQQFCWLNYESLTAVAETINTGDSEKKLFEDSYKFNLPNMSKKLDISSEKRVKNSMLVYVPSLNRGTYLHCSYQSSKCKLRDYTLSATIPPRPDDRFTRQQIFSWATDIRPAAHVSYTQVQFWHDEIVRTNTLLANSQSKIIRN